MSTLKQAIEYSKKNPQDARAIELMNQIKSGKMDSKAIEEGIDLTGKSPSFQDKIKKESSPLTRVSEGIQESAENINDAIEGAGKFEDRSLLGRGVGATAEGFSAVSQTAYNVLPEKIRNTLDDIAGGIGRGIEAYNNIPMVKRAADRLVNETDPEVLAKTEEALQVLADAGIIAGEIVGAGETAIAGNVAQKTFQKGANQVKTATLESTRKLLEAGGNKTRAIRESLNLSEPKTVQEAVGSIREAYKTAFVDDQVSINNKLSKMGRKNNSSPDELLDKIANEGYAPDVEGKLAKMDSVFDDIDSRQLEISNEIDKTIKTYDTTTSIDDLFDRIDNEIRNSEFVSASDLDKSLRELNRVKGSVKTRYGEQLTPSQVNELRKQMNRKTKAFNKKIFEEDVANSIARVTRERIDEIIPEESVRSANAEWGRLQEIRNIAEIFDNKPIRVNELGKTLGSFAGVTSASALGFSLGGPGGLVVAGLSAKYGGDTITRFLRSRKFNKKAQELIRESLKENPSVLDDLIKNSRPENARFLETLRLEAPKDPEIRTQIGSSETINLPERTEDLSFERGVNKIQ